MNFQFEEKDTFAFELRKQEKPGKLSPSPNGPPSYPKADLI